MVNEIIHIHQEIKQLITPKQALYYRIIPHSSEQDILTLYIDNQNTGKEIAMELEIVFGKKIKLLPLDTSSIEEALKRYYPNKSDIVPGLAMNKFHGDKDSVVQKLILEALSYSSSDIHFEALEKHARVRYRIDGHLVDKYFMDTCEYPAIVNTIKIKAGLDIAEKRLPQDGRIYYNKSGKKLDIRVSIIPTINGEKIVFRLLNKDTSNLELEKTGLSTEQLFYFQQGIGQSHGMILISGPTGSGKTTTLYATMKKLNTGDRNILTIEDPIEYTMDGINQVQLKESIGLTFPTALRTFLRQDPDIIMVGEIRDSETAQIAIRAALTGHLVLSTIHTNSAWGIVSRLTDMGVAGYLIAGTLNLAVAQRLFRLLCPACKRAVREMPLLMDQFFSTESCEIFQPTGCELCNFTGYKGRRAVFEVIVVDHIIRNRIKSNQFHIDRILKERNIKNLSDQAKELFLSGQTSFDEILPLLLTSIHS